MSTVDLLAPERAPSRRLLANVWTIARHDIRRQLRQGTTLAWIFLMPPVFFYFIGNAMGGFGIDAARTTPDALLVRDAGEAGALRDRLDALLRENGFAPIWSGAGVGSETKQETDTAAKTNAGTEEPADIGTRTSSSTDSDTDAPPAAISRRLLLPPSFSDALLAGDPIRLDYASDTAAPARDAELLRLRKALYTLLADLVVAEARAPDATSINASDLAAVDALPRTLELRVASAGGASAVPAGYRQSVPGIMVMFTLLVLLTGAAPALVSERRQGLLRRLASAPLSRGELILGKWTARMLLAAIQLGVAALVGWALFGVDWGSRWPMVAVLLLAWAAFCASLGLLLGAVSGTETRAVATGMLIGNLLAALGGCWWPIEVTPNWMRTLQDALPTGWAMDGLHRLINHGHDAASALPQVLALALSALLVGAVAARRLQYA